MKLIATFVASPARRFLGVPLLLAFVGACSGDADAGVPSLPGDNAALKDQGAPFNSEPAALGGTDASRRASFDSTPSPSGLEICSEHCGGGCAAFCVVLCGLCPSADLARCLSGGPGEGRENEGEGDQCELKAESCLATYGCALPENIVQEDSEEQF
jgi:hypothetical protein